MADLIEKRNLDDVIDFLDLDNYSEFKNPVIGIWDWDGSLKSYGNLAILANNYIVPSSFSSCSNFKKKILEAGAGIFPVHFHPTMLNVLEELSDTIDYSFVYSLGSKDRIENNVLKYNFDKYFNNVIASKNKNSDELLFYLKQITRYSEKELKNDVTILNFGDSRVDLEASYFCKNKINIGIESGLEKKKDEFFKMCDIYICKEGLKNPESSKSLSNLIKKYINFQQKSI